MILDFTIVIATKGGQFFGGVFITLLGLLGKEITITSLFLLFTIIYIGIIVFVYFSFNDLRVKAISRVMKKIA